MSISERIRPGIEAAEWVCVEVAKLEASYEALRQQVKELEESTTLKSWFEANKRANELEGYKAAWIETSKCRDKAERELTAERAISEELEKALKNFVVACDSSICSGAELSAYHAAKHVLTELAAMRKGETE